MADIPQNTGTTRPSNQTASSKSVVGISFPFRKEDGEFPKRDYDRDCVQNDVFTLFQTPARSRIHRPKVGHNAFPAVFESQSGILNARLQRTIRQTIKNNEPRVIVLKITTVNSGTEVTPTVEYMTQGIKDKVELNGIQTGG